MDPVLPRFTYMGWQMQAGATAIVAMSLVASPVACGSGCAVPVPAVVGTVATHFVLQGDSLNSISARAGVDVAVLTAENGIRAEALLHLGQQLRVDNRHIVPDITPGVVVINAPQRMLFYLGDDGVLEAFPVAVGRRGWATPVGSFTVTVKETQPTWDVPRSIREEALRQGRTLPDKVPPGPENPLGAFWLGLSIGGVGIHGTNAPASIYRAATHGCIRLHPDDIARLFTRVSAGTVGRMVYEPVLLTVDRDVVYLEAHRDVYGRLAVAPGELVRQLADARGLTDRIDWTLADAVLAVRDGLARDVSKQALER